MVALVTLVLGPDAVLGKLAIFAAVGDVLLPITNSKCPFPNSEKYWLGWETAFSNTTYPWRWGVPLWLTSSPKIMYLTP